MTPAELALALDDDIEKTRPPHGGADMSVAEVEAYAKAWRSLTPRQRLERAKEAR